MTSISQTDGHIPSNEPYVVVNISQTEVGPEVEPEVYRLPYPPELTLKRRVSESFLQTRGYWKKRRKSLGRVQETAIDCPCLPPPTYDVAMTEAASKLDSAYSTLPTTPPTPDNNGNESHARRPSQVAEIIEKVNTKLKRLFGSRRESAEDEHLSLNPTVTQLPSTSGSIGGPKEDPHIHSSEDLAGIGLAALPNVSEYFDVNGEVGPSCFYGTSDWNNFQAKLRDQRRNTIHSQLNTDLHYDGDGNLEQLEKLRQDSTQTERCEERERKDSQFSFCEFLKPRRFSKVEKGKGRMVYDDEEESLSQNSLLLPYQGTSSDAAGPSNTQIAVPSGKVSDKTLVVVSDKPIDSYSRIDMYPEQSSAPVSPKGIDIPLRAEPTTRRVSVRLVPPTPCPIRGQRRSSTTSTSSSSSSVSSFGSTTLINPSRLLRRLTRDIVTSQGEEVIDDHSEPISIPSSRHHSRQSSTVAEGSARPLNDSPTLPPSLGSSATDLLSHGYRPDTTPSSPSLPPTLVPSPEAMQALHLGPPQRALLHRSASSSSRMFHVSVEQLSTTTSAESISTPNNPAAMAQKGDVDRDEEVALDFSITHPAPPSPLASVSPLAEVPSPVKRRTGSLEGKEDLRAVYIEQGRASVLNYPPRRRSPRKSLQGRTWWDESPPKVYL